MKQLPACLPVGFSPSGELEYAMSSSGDLLVVDPAAISVAIVAPAACPAACHVGRSWVYASEACIEVVGRRMDVVTYHAESRRVFSRAKVEELEGGEILSCRPCYAGLAAIVSYPNQRPSELVILQGNHAHRVLPLQYRYKWPPGGLAVLNSDRLAACEYGDKGQDVAIVDLQHDQVLSALHGHEYWVDACEFVSQSMLVTGGKDQSVRFWHLPDGDLLQTFEGIGHVKGIRWAKTFGALVILASSPSSKLAKDFRGDDVPIYESRLWVWRLDGKPPRITVCGTWDEHYAQSFSLTPREDIVITGEYPHGSGEGTATMRMWRMADLLPD